MCENSVPMGIHACPNTVTLFYNTVTLFYNTDTLYIYNYSHTPIGVYTSLLYY